MKPRSLTLMYRIDGSKNMARFYALVTTPTLFGEVSVLRNWGRIGTGGQLCLMTFATAQEANQELARLHRVKSRRGYVTRT